MFKVFARFERSAHQTPRRTAKILADQSVIDEANRAVYRPQQII